MYSLGYALPIIQSVPDATATPPTTNLALFSKATKQSSTLVQSGTKASSDRAVDGDWSQDFKEGSCTQTKAEKAAWWRVDLKRVAQINKVTVYNRADCCGKRLSPFDVRIGDNPTPFLNGSLLAP